MTNVWYMNINININITINIAINIVYDIIWFITPANGMGHKMPHASSNLDYGPVHGYINHYQDCNTFFECHPVHELMRLSKKVLPVAISPNKTHTFLARDSHTATDVTNATQCQLIQMHASVQRVRRHIRGWILFLQSSAQILYVPPQARSSC